jgi:hypothetical protein
MCEGRYDWQTGGVLRWWMCCRLVCEGRYDWQTGGVPGACRMECERCCVCCYVPCLELFHWHRICCMHDRWGGEVEEC